ncbi:hypothetical protein MMC30_004912 [Trapelia coarctata]|nr:hypothetical protein [Trapelia coarctata]
MESLNPPHCHLCGRTNDIEQDYQFRHHATEEVAFGSSDVFRGPPGMDPGLAELHIKLCIECDHIIRAYRNEVYNPALDAVVNPWKAEEFINDLEKNRPARSADWSFERLIRWHVEGTLLAALKRRRDFGPPPPDSSDSFCFSMAESERGLLQGQGDSDLDNDLLKVEVRGADRVDKRKGRFLERLKRCMKRLGGKGATRKHAPRQ